MSGASIVTLTGLYLFVIDNDEKRIIAVVFLIDGNRQSRDKVHG